MHCLPPRGTSAVRRPGAALLLAFAGLLAACRPGAASAGRAAQPPSTSITATLPVASGLAALTAAVPTRAGQLSTAVPTLAPPTATAILLPSPSAMPEVELLFTGDINPGRCVYAKAKAAEDMALPYRPLADVLQGADITAGSLDGTISDYNPPSPCVETTRNLLAPAEVVDGLSFAGYDVMAVATNHIKDCGLVRGCDDEALLDTLANLRAAGIQPAGAGRNLAEAMTPAILTVGGVRFAFLGFTAINHAIWATADEAGPAPFERPVYLEAIRQARARADVVIVLPHWGREYSAAINYSQRAAAAEMVGAGASLVIGNHPHRVQGVEIFPNGAVAAYALGNFVFDQAWSDGTQYTIQGVMLRAVFRGARLDRVELLPIHIYDDFQPRLADEAEAAIILQAVADSMAAAPPR